MNAWNVILSHNKRQVTWAYKHSGASDKGYAVIKASLIEILCKNNEKHSDRYMPETEHQNWRSMNLGWILASLTLMKHYKTLHVTYHVNAVTNKRFFTFICTKITTIAITESSLSSTTILTSYPVYLFCYDNRANEKKEENRFISLKAFALRFTVCMNCCNEPLFFK